MKKRVRYKVSDVFAVPLAYGGYALGVIARLNKSYGGILLGYFFKEHYEEMPKEINYSFLKPTKVKLVMRLSHLGVSQGEWPLVGMIPDFQVSEWMIPHFIYRFEHTHTAQRRIYDEDELGVFAYQLPEKYDCDLFKDTLWGYCVAAEAIGDMVKMGDDYCTPSLR